MKNYAIGIDIYGNEKKFEVVRGQVYCYKNQLTSLTLPEGVKIVYCSHNQLTSLTLPEGVREVNCSHNQLTSLTLPEGVKWVDCYGNPFIGENYFVNPKTGRVVIFQDGLFYAGCFCGKTKEKLIVKCKEEGFIEVLQHFGLN